MANKVFTINGKQYIRRKTSNWGVCVDSSKDLRCAFYNPNRKRGESCRDGREHI
jgi:hypothetical protein